MNINSYMPVKIVSGKNCLKKNINLLAKMGKRCLIVTGGSSAKLCGALADAENALKESGIEYEIFDGITQNPYTADCHRAGGQARSFGADFIFGIGGGSPLDASKAVAIYAANEDLSPADIYSGKYKNKPIPVALIGTTAGTGSELTGVAVLTDSDTNMKKSISGENCYAAVSFCDYTYTMSVPYSVTISTCLDAFAHAVESYLATTSDDMSDLYCEKVFAMFGNILADFYNHKKLPDENTRETLYIASLFAGLAINITGTCFPHAVGYVLTEDFNIPHGRACAAFLSDFIDFCADVCPEKTEKMFSILDVSRGYLKTVLNALADIKITVSDEQLERYAKRWSLPVKNFSRTPGSFTGETAVKVISKYKG